MMCSIEELGSDRDMYPEAPEERHLYASRRMQRSGRRRSAKPWA